MPTTTKMGIVYPASTDLVKDGATAMGTISTTVDAKTGLVLLSTTSFSAVSSQSLSTIFDSNYRDYRIVMDFNCTAPLTLSVRLRTGSDDSTAQYQRQYLVSAGGSVSGGRETNQTQFSIGGFGNARNVVTADIYSPNVAQVTSGQFTAVYNTGSTIIEYLTNSFGMNTTTQYTGISFLTSTSSITGSVSVYGYNK